MTTVPTIGEQLAENLVAVDVRVAGWDGYTCAVCKRTVQAGERVADLADGRGLVHVAGCSRDPRAAASAAARAPRPERQRLAPRGA
jgi:hypothetical protein